MRVAEEALEAKRLEGTMGDPMNMFFLSAPPAAGLLRASDRAPPPATAAEDVASRPA